MEIHEEEEPKRVQYPLDYRSYKILGELGVGFQAFVNQALCLPMNSLVAIKSIGFYGSRSDFDGVVREAQTLSLLSHPNILSPHCSFALHDLRLWVVLPFMAGGSLQSIISHSFPYGLGEPCIAVVLKEILKAVSYLHGQGRLHRDIKAGNILIDSNGLVKLADFGVSASIYEPYSSEVGKSYWMAPEVIHSHAGYSFKADIWSFGITALELAHGRPPLSQFPSSQSMIVEIKKRFHFSKFNKDRKGKKKMFSRTFKDMVASCLDQDPLKRPTAEELLEHPFFQSCKGSEILVKNLLQGLPSVEARHKKSMLKTYRDMDIDDEEDYQLKQNVEQRRICGWNFNEDGLELDPVFPTEPKDDTVAKTVRVEGETIIQDMGGELHHQEENFVADSVGTELPYPNAAEPESLTGMLGCNRIGGVQIGREGINREDILVTLKEMKLSLEVQLRQIKTLMNKVQGVINCEEQTTEEIGRLRAELEDERNKSSLLELQLEDMKQLQHSTGCSNSKC